MYVPRIYWVFLSLQQSLILQEDGIGIMTSSKNLLVLALPLARLYTLFGVTSDKVAKQGQGDVSSCRATTAD